MQRNLKQKAQGAIEYLLIIGASILVVAIVIIALVTLTGTTNINEESGSTLDALQQLKDQQLGIINNNETEEPETPINNQIYLVELLETKTIGEILADAPNLILLEYEEETCTKYSSDSISCNSGSTQNTQITSGEKIILNPTDCETVFDLNEELFGAVLEDYREMIVEKYEKQYLYFTPDESLNTIPKIFNDAPDGTRITVGTINYEFHQSNETPVIYYEKENDNLTITNDNSNGLFNVLEESDEAIIYIQEYPYGIIGNYSKKISGTIQNEQTQNKYEILITNPFETINREQYNEYFVRYVLTKDYSCYTVEQALNKIKEVLQTNYHAEIGFCSSWKYDEDLDGFSEETNNYGSGCAKQLTPADVMEIYVYLPVEETLPEIDFSCN